MIRRPPRSTLFPSRRSSDLEKLRCMADRRERVADFVRDVGGEPAERGEDRKSTRLNSSHSQISYAVFCLKKKKKLKIDSVIMTEAQIPYPYITSSSPAIGTI